MRRSSGHGRYFGSPRPSCSTLRIGEADVEADEIGERQRPHRVIHPELHHGVDRFGRADAFHHREDRLVDHRHQDAVRDEARDSRPLRRRSCRASRTAPTRSCIDSSDVAWPRISSTSVISGTGFMKCMPSTLSGPLRGGAEHRDRDRRRVRREDRLRLGERVEAVNSARLASAFSTIASTT